jgi:UDP-N-acetyl-D-glucosamine dehydrogenase
MKKRLHKMVDEKHYVEELKNKFLSKEACVGILGLGYVGLPLGLTFAEKGFSVLGFDIDQEKIHLISAGTSYIKHIGSERVDNAVKAGRLSATSDFSRTAEPDALILCVPTPLDKYREPDLSFVINTFEAMLPYVRKGQLISLESTTYPGTTEEELRSRLEEDRGFQVGNDLFLVYSPEREDPGNKKFNTATIPKVVGGTTPSCLEVGKALYGAVIEKVVPVSSTKAAELTKLLENIYRAVNIGLVNEMKIIADRMGIDIWEVIEAAASKPFGFTPFYPGPGLGGHCIPIDPFYLTWKARAYEVNTRFIELAGEVNAAMPEWVINKTMEALNEQGKAMKGSRILVLGLSYKKNIDDIRESPSVRLLELLREKGADYGYIDPFYPTFPKMREHHFDLATTPFTIENIRTADCIIVATDHDAFDYDVLQREAKLIVDTRGRYRKNFSNVVKS